MHFTCSHRSTRDLRMGHLNSNRIKVVIWLPVNRLPVKLLVTDLPTYFLHVMQISASASSRTCEQRQAYIGPRHTGAIDGSVPLVQVYPVFDCRLSSLLLSPPRVGSPQPGKVGGKRCELDGRCGWHTLRPRVTARHFFWSNRCCMHGRRFNVDGDMSRFSWPSLALLGLHSSRRYA